jgi:hypothetical protein
MRALVLAALLFPACSDSSTKTPDARTLEADAPKTPDAPTSACTGACRTLTAKASNGPKTVTFDRAFYGYNGTNADPTSLRIELHHGGNATCPEMNSPSPDQTTIVSAIPVTARTVPATDNASKVSYLDFARTISDSTIVRSSTVALTGISASFTAADLYVAFDVNATLAESITITGHVFAIHCASLDEMP